MVTSPPGSSSSGDIDILLGHPDYTSEGSPKKKPAFIKAVVARLEEEGFVTDTLSAGESKFMVGLRAGLLTIFYCECLYV